MKVGLASTAFGPCPRQTCRLLVFLIGIATASAQINFQTLHTFGQPKTSGPFLATSDGNLYGTSAGGGDYEIGSTFRIDTNGMLTTLYSFTGGDDGFVPSGGLVQGSDGNFYGVANLGGAGGDGTIFRIDTNGALSTLYAFSGSDGASPSAALVQANDGNFYGVTGSGGANGAGTVFRINTAGALTTLHSFSGDDGWLPSAALVQASDGNLYGVTEDGGEGFGTVFQITTNGILTTLYSFTGDVNGPGNEGGWPFARLVQGSDGSLYGTTCYGGVGGNGVVFRITTNGVLTNLYSFGPGGNPYAGLIQLSDSNLYGTTANGGTSNQGTLFSITTNGALTTLYSFSGQGDGGNPHMGLVQASDGNLYGSTFDGGNSGAGTAFCASTNNGLTTLLSFTNGNGSDPSSSLIQASDGNLYGTTVAGGIAGSGTVFRVTTNGLLTTLYSFSGANDGGSPSANLVQASDGNFYGTTSTGGVSGAGTIFKIDTNGVFNTVYSFTGGNNGFSPSPLIQATDGNFYGTTYGGSYRGGWWYYGTVFRITTNGLFSTLYVFGGGSDGAFPAAGLLQANDGNLYGTTTCGGANGNGPSSLGTVFRITTNGVLTTIHSFTYTNDGQQPAAVLVQGSDGYLYGTTLWSAHTTWGTVFRISTNGALTTLYYFTGSTDGSHPEGGLVQANDGNFYGTTSAGGIAQWGTVFSITTNGTLTSVHRFYGDGSTPCAGLVQASDGNLYGTVSEGGALGGGTLFRIAIGTSTLVSPVNIQCTSRAEGYWGFSFQTVAGQSYTIQQTTNPATSNWTGYTNFVGHGSIVQLLIPEGGRPQRFFRVREP